MSSWVLQLVLLAACLRFGCFEGDPLPAALVEMVRNSPITSIQDLQLLLLSDSVEEDPDSQPAVGLHSNNTFSRSPRSLEAEPAQQALCKVRTEVLEVTRTMLDRRNANFMLWPPCVEVQRCSGCCNARTLQCVPVITQTRYLQVMKIQYVSRRPHYDKAVISVQDHVECRCQSAPLPKGARTAPKKLHPRRQGPKDPPSRTRSKEELHRRDELKWNQNFHLDERQPRYPPERTLAPRGDNALPGRARALEAQTGRPPLQVPLGAFNLTGQWEEEEEEERALLTGLGLRRPPQGAGQSGLRENGHNATEESWADGRRPAWLNVTENATQGGRRGPARDRAVAVDTWDPETQTGSAASQSLTETRPPTGGAGETAQVRRGGRPAERGEERGLLRQEQLTLEEERGALLLLQQKLDQENRQIQILQRQQHHHHDHRHQHLHHQTQTHTTTQTAVTAPLPTTTRPPPPTRPPPVPVTARTPARKAPPKRRMRKNRNRISKAAMRAMLM